MSVTARTCGYRRSSPGVSESTVTLSDVICGLRVERIDSRTATKLVVERHYLHRKTSVSFAFGVFQGPKLMGVVTFGTPPSRHLQKSACPSDPSLVIELNRLWTDDRLPPNSESWFVSRALRMLPPRIVVSYADPKAGHYGYIYRALNFNYAGWTDMDRKTPRYDYIPLDPTQHTREAFRSGYAYKVRRVPKVKYWITTGNRAERKMMTRLCAWPSLSWLEFPPPVYTEAGVIQS
ncbi:acetyltransferase [Mycobacterium phage MKC-IRE-02]